MQIEITQYFKGSEYNPSVDSPHVLNLKENFKVIQLEKGPLVSTESRLLATLFDIGKGEPIDSKMHGPGTIYLTEGQAPYFNWRTYFPPTSTGELHIEDHARPGKPTILTPGDVVLVDSDIIAHISSPSGAKGMSDLKPEREF